GEHRAAMAESPGGRDLVSGDLWIRLRRVERALLPVDHEAARNAVVLRHAVRFRRDQLHVPPATCRDDAGDVARGNTGWVPDHSQGSSAHHALVATGERRRGGVELPGPGEGARGEARGNLVPVPAQSALRSFADRELPGVPAADVPLRLRVPPSLMDRGAGGAGVPGRGVVRCRYG